MQNLKIRWCDIHRLSRLSGSIEDVYSRLNPKAEILSSTPGADLASATFFQGQGITAFQGRCIDYQVMSIIALKPPPTSMNVRCYSYLPELRFLRRRDATSVSLRTQRKWEPTSESSLIGCGLSIQYTSPKLGVLVSGPWTLPMSLPSNSASSRLSCGSFQAGFLWIFKLFFVKQNFYCTTYIYFIVINSYSNINIIHYILKSHNVAKKNIYVGLPKSKSLPSR